MGEKQDDERAQGRKKQKKSSKYIKYGIIIVGLSFLLSSFSYDVNKSQNADDDDPTASWNMVRYESGSIGSASAVALITGATEEYKLRPLRMDKVSQEDVTYVFASNVTGVLGITLETGGGDEMFGIATDGSQNVSAEIKKRIRLPGGYTLYRVYKAATPAGELKVIGENLEAGDYVKVILMERVKGGVSDVLGYAQGKVAVGPLVDATVLGFDNVEFGAISPRNVSADDFKRFSNASNVEITFEGGNGTAGAWTVAFSLPADADAVEVEADLSSMNMTNVSSARFGYVRAPSEMVLQGRAVSIPDGGGIQARLRPGAKVNDPVRVAVYIMPLGNQTAAFAIDSSGNGTGAQ
jgi:hypothetical protein